MGFWDGLVHTGEVFKGNEIYNPLTGTYVRVRPETVPAASVAELSSPGAHSASARLTQIEILRVNGAITDQEAEAARARVLGGL